MSIEDSRATPDAAQRAPMAFYRMSLPDGRYEYVSSGCRGLTGYSPEEFYARPLLVREFIHPTSRAYFEQAWSKLLAGDLPPVYEYAIVDRAGHTRWLRQQNVPVQDTEGRVVAIEGVVSEVTAEKRAEELQRDLDERSSELEAVIRRLQVEVAAHQQVLADLRDSESQLRLLIDHLPAAVSYVDSNQRYRFNNRTYEAWFGHSHSEIYGKTVRDVVGDAAYALIEDPLRSALLGEAMTFEASLPYTRGGTRYVRASYIPHWDESRRQVKGVIVLLNDISDAKRIEISERRHLLELAHVSRLTSLGEITTELAHELAQPLAAIVNYSHVCSKLLESDRQDELRAIAEKLAAQAKRGQEILDGFRQYVKKGRPERQLLPLGELVEHALGLIRWDAEAHGLTLKLDAAAPLPRVSVDRTLLEQVIVNLVRNAIEAMEGQAGKTITVAVGVFGDSVEVAVRDGGCGLPPEVKERLFEPFFTTKPDGVGVGLVLCRRILESHGGRLWAEDNLAGPGAVFRFSLPV